MTTYRRYRKWALFFLPPQYMKWRYLTHPVYAYQWICVYDEAGKLRAAGVYRVEESEGERTIHVVEFLGEGDAAIRLASALCEVMREQRASFLGFRCARRRSFEAWGHVGGGLYASEDEDYELPSLFQPLVAQYRPLAWGHRLDRKLDSAALTDLYVTRSDGDQNRPSRIGKIT